jgi:hypothetical protein
MSVPNMTLAPVKEKRRARRSRIAARAGGGGGAFRTCGRCEVSATPHPTPQRERPEARERQRGTQQPPRRERRCGGVGGCRRVGRSLRWHRGAVDRCTVEERVQFLARPHRAGKNTAAPELLASLGRNPKRNTRDRVARAAGRQTSAALRARHSRRQKREHHEPYGRVSNHFSSAQPQHQIPALDGPRLASLVSTNGGQRARRNRRRR